MNKIKRRQQKKAVVLLSGGLDSAVTLYWAKTKGYAPYCLSFDYGQRHQRELRSAKRIAGQCGCAWRVIRFRLPWKGSALLDRKISVPKGRLIDKAIPVTYVSGRNVVFLSFAASFAEVIGADTVCIGANQVDFSGYPDCRGTFLRAFERALKLGTKQGAQGRGISIIAPLLHKTKAQIVKLAVRLGVPLELTWSCYEGRQRPCGYCDSCRLRQRGFTEAKIKDPLI